MWPGHTRWVVLGTSLFLATFGVYGVSLLLYLILGVGGIVGVAVYYGSGESSSQLESEIIMPLSSPGIKAVQKLMEGSVKIKRFDKRITGSSVIDEVLQSVLEYYARDYIKNWYREVSDDDYFLMQIQQCVQKVFITFSQRTKDVDWMPYFTQKMVDDFASHIRLYTRALGKSKVANKDERAPLLEQNFFDLEIEMEGDICRDLVSLSPQDERQYLQDLTDVLLFLFLPTEDYNNKPFRYFIREVVVNGIFIPNIDLLSDPDYINLYIAWMCRGGSFTNEMFMSVIKTTDSIPELDSVIEMLDCDIAKWRSKDTGGSDDVQIKQNLNSLLFVKNLCEEKIKRLHQGIDDTEFAPDVPEHMRSGATQFVLCFDDIINNSKALQAFIEFMSSVGGQHMLFFYLNIEGFRAAAEQQLKEASNHGNGDGFDLEPFRNQVNIIYNQYLSEKASSRVRIEPDILKRCAANIKNKHMKANIFDEVQARVYQMLHGEQYYEAFIQSPAYTKVLDDLGFNSSDCLNMEDSLSMSSSDVSEDYCESSSSSSALYNSSPRSGSPYKGSSVLEVYSISAMISMTGIIRESEKTGKSYAVFSIRVTRKSSEGEEIWDVYRRYSDFHDFQMIMSEKLPNFHGPALPPKSLLRNNTDEFLEKRRKALDTYLQELLSAEVWEKHPGVQQIVMKFLAPGIWERHKSDLARKMDTIVNPLKTVGHAVKTISNDGVSKLRGDSFNKSSGSMLHGAKVGAGLDPEINENIPLRIMLLLMDEVFDLRHKNQWLRRQIVRVLQQLIKAILGDRMNKKIVEHVDWMTSAEQVAEYIKAFRDSFWPEGVLAEPRPPRDDNIRMRTRVVCKAKMLGSIPDELRHFLGSDTVRIGTGRVFDMFQYRSLNRRLVYVFLEGVIETLFPENHFKALFRKMHSQSARLKAKNNGDQATTSARGKKSS